MTNDFLLGGTLRVNRMGFGAMRAPMTDRSTALKVLRTTADLGIDHIDTAAFYRRDGLAANELIHAALHPYDEGLVIATKVGPTLDAAGAIVQRGPAELAGQVEDNLRELGRDHLDLVYLRIGLAGPPPNESLAERFAALAHLREKGLIRHLGLSNVGSEHLAEARGIAPVVAVQNLYGVGAREDEALLAECAAAGIAYVPFFPLGGHGLAVSPALDRVAARHGATVAQVALAWLLATSPAVLAIPGTSSPAHLAENVAAADLALTDEDLTDLSPAD